MIDRLMDFDTLILKVFVTEHTVVPVTITMIAISELGSVTVVFGLTLIAAILYAYKRHFAVALALCASVFGTAGAVLVLKELFHRSRPDLIYQAYQETGHSFPSAHAALSVALYGFLGYVMIRRARSRTVKAGLFFVSLMLPALIGFTRIYLGVHYTTDVIGGFMVGGVVVWLAVIFLKKIEPRFSPQEAS